MSSRLGAVVALGLNKSNGSSLSSKSGLESWWRLAFRVIDKNRRNWGILSRLIGIAASLHLNGVVPCPFCSTDPGNGFNWAPFPGSP